MNGVSQWVYMLSEDEWDAFHWIKCSVNQGGVVIKGNEKCLKWPLNWVNVSSDHGSKQRNVALLFVTI